jgi:hypothetical protein
MHRAALLIALAAAAAVPGRAAPPRPNAPPPEVITVQLDKNGNLVSQRTQTVYTSEARMVKRVVDGNEVLYQEVVTVPRSVPIATQARLKDVKAFDLNGLPIDAEKLPKLLEKGASVIVSPDGQPVDGFYRQFFKEETLMLVMPGRSGTTVSGDPTFPVPAPRPVPPRGAP